MADKSIEIKHFSIGLPRKLSYGEDKEINTAIYKESVAEAFLGFEGFRGDGVGDLKHHGGVDRAVCVYPEEHYDFWKQTFNEELPAAVFGENLTVKGMLEKDIYIGDVYHIGEAIVQVAQPRVPCSTITKRTGNPQLLQQMVEHGYTGFLFRVLEEGTVRNNSEITLIERHPEQMSIAYCNDIYFSGSKNLQWIQKLIEVKELAEEWRDGLRKRLSKLA